MPQESHSKGRRRRRAAYAFCLYYATLEAKRLGYSRISALEFGVAGGNGIIALQTYAREIKRELGIEVEIYGFDSGAGLPKPRDFRDVPYLWQTGFYPIDETKLRARLEGSQLVMGDVADTAKTFLTTTILPQSAPHFSTWISLHLPLPKSCTYSKLTTIIYFASLLLFATTTELIGLGALNDYTGER